MIDSTGKFWWIQLDEEAAARPDQPSFHAFAEGMHSDVRGEVITLPAGSNFDLPHDRWPRHLSIVIGIEGVLDAEIGGRTIGLRALSQLVVLPGVPCRLKAATPVTTIEWISLISMSPLKTG
jgi:hypothetical protein